MTTMTDAEFQNQISKLSELIKLDINKVEFEDLRKLILYQLAKDKNIVGFMNSDTIVFLIDAIAALGAYTQYSIDAAYGEGNLHSARLDSSIRSIIRTLGVRQKRKTPAYFTAEITNPGITGTMTIPPYTEFTNGSSSFFNRDPITILTTDLTVEATLFEGKLINKNATNLSGSNLRYISDETDFTVADDDVRVKLNGTEITIVKRPIWEFRREGSDPIYVVEDFTTAVGKLEIRFGNLNYAFLPNLSDVISISYVVTKGSVGRSITTLNQLFTANYANKKIEAIGITSMSGGSNEIDAATYKLIGPLAFSSQKRAVDKNGYESVPFEFGGIIDAKCIRQAYYAPEDIRYSNIIRVSLLTEDTLTTTIWNNFNEFMLNNGLATAKYERFDPTPVPIDIEANIHIKNTAKPSVVEDAIRLALSNLFKQKLGSLGMTIAVSDIVETITTSTPGISFVSLITPKNDCNTRIFNLKPATAEEITGTLAVGTWQFYYTFTPTNLKPTAGESLPFQYNFVEGVDSYIASGDNKGFRLTLNSWSLRGSTIKVYSRYFDGTNVTTRKVYDGIPTNQDSPLVIDVTATTMGTILYTGTNPSETGLNKIDNSGIFYNELGDVILNVYVTDRQELTYRKGVS